MQNLVTPLARRQAYESSGLWNEETLVGRLERHATEQPNHIAVIDGTDGRSVTYHQLFSDAGNIAAFFSEAGIGAGEVVSVQLPNRY
jgi:non-ribosomal peptide synthetase component E (peptide arylation enzyme)